MLLMKTKRKTSFALSDEAMHLLRLLADKWSVSLSAALELLIRAMADRKGKL